MSTNPSSNMNTNTPNTQNQPGLVAAHAEYIKGATEVRLPPSSPPAGGLKANARPSPQSTIGNLTGSHAWTTSGEQDKAHAKASMQAANQNRDPQRDGYGKVEEVAGKLTGCEGMRQEGAASAQKGRSE